MKDKKRNNDSSCCSLCNGETKDVKLYNDGHFYCPTCGKGMTHATKGKICEIKTKYKNDNKESFGDTLRRMCSDNSSN